MNVKINFVSLLVAFAMITGCGEKKNAPSAEEYRAKLQAIVDSAEGRRIDISKEVDIYRTLSDDEKKKAYSELD